MKKKMELKIIIYEIVCRINSLAQRDAIVSASNNVYCIYKNTIVKIWWIFIGLRKGLKPRTSVR